MYIYACKHIHVHNFCQPSWRLDVPPSLTILVSNWNAFATKSVSLSTYWAIYMNSNVKPNNIDDGVLFYR